MAPDVTETPRHAACPACGAALRPGSPWCTLCYTDLRPPAENPRAEAPAGAASASPAGDPLTQPLLDFIAPPPRAPEQPGVRPAAPVQAGHWPCASCGASNPLDASSCASCGAPFLSAVGLSTRPSVVLPLVGDISRFSRTQRLLGGLGIALLVMLPVALITLVLSKHPAPDPHPIVQVTEFPQQGPISPAPVVPTEPGPSASPSPTAPAVPGFPTPAPVVTP